MRCMLLITLIFKKNTRITINMKENFTKILSIITNDLISLISIPAWKRRSWHLMSLSDKVSDNSNYF